MAVALTMGLAITSRTVTDVEISGNTEEAARAFSVAEAGIESALVGGALEGGFPETGATYHSAVTNLGAGTEFVFPQQIKVGETQTLWLVEHNANGTINETAFYTTATIDVCWSGTAALEVIIYYKDGVTYKVARGAYDANAAAHANNFSSPDLGSCAGLNNKKTLNFVNDFGLPANRTLLFLRLRVLYANATVGVRTPGGGGGVLPSQGKKIESTGTAGTSNRKVEVIRMHPAPPGIFDFLLYSGSDLKHE
jgi:hypothetical protein